MFKNTLSPLPSILGIALTASLASAAHAQEQERGAERVRESGIEEIVITATRFETALQDTPLAISAITAAALEARGSTDISQIAATVPNASFRRAPSVQGNAMIAYIRGVGQSDTMLAFEPGVAMYVDDVYYALVAGSVFDLLDLERVEVLRGPQGTLFGRGAVGGAVHMISRAPDSSPSAYVDATVGSYNRLDLRAGFNVPLADNLFLRVAAVSKSRKGYMKALDFRCDMIQRGTPELAGNIFSTDYSGGNLRNYRDNCEIGRYNGEDVQAIRATMRYEPDDRWDITVTGDYLKDNSTVRSEKLLEVQRTAGSINLDENVYQPLWGVAYDDRFVTDSPYSTYATYSDPIPAGTIFPGTYYNGLSTRGGEQYDPRAPVINWGLSLKSDYAFTDALSVTGIFAYRNLDTAGVFDGDASPLGLQTVKTVTTHEQYTAEVRALYSTALLDLTVGGFYYTADALTTQAGSIAFINHHQNAWFPFENESKSLFAHSSIRLMEDLSLTAGLRYTWDKKDAYFDNGTDYASGLVRAAVNVRGESFDWRLGLDYKLTDDVLLYASAATGYRPPSYNPRPFQPSQVVQVDGEDMTAYELGFKADLFDRALRVNAAAFYSDFGNRIVSVGGTECRTGTGGTGQPDCEIISRTNFINSPGKIKGIELEVVAEPIYGLQFNGSLGYTDFHAPELDPAVNPNIRSTVPNYVPRWTGSAGVQYDIAVPGLRGTITPRIDAFYQSAISFNATSPRAQEPGYWMSNARISYAPDDRAWSVAIGATNLFNKLYYVSRFDLISFGQPASLAQPGPPREFYLQFKKSF